MSERRKKMAKRYIRINFQNSPSTATPLSATNLNKMDKGIDDLDNAIEAINDNLTTHIASNVRHLSDGTMGATDNFNSYVSNGVYSFNTVASMINSPGIGDYGGLVVFQNNNAHVLQIAFNAGSGVIKTRTRTSSTWSVWKTISLS